MPYEKLVMKIVLTVLLLFTLSPLQLSLADDSPYKIVFENNYILLSVSNDVATISELKSNKPIKVKIGETFEAPKDKHSKTIYTVISTGRESIEIKYKASFDASSFGGPITENEGKFVVTITK